MNNNWLVISGNAKIEDNGIIYTPKKTIYPNTENTNLLTLVNSDIEFKNGIIEFSIKTEDNSALCQLILDTNTPSSPIYIGMNTSGILFGMTKYNSTSGNWEFQAGGGNKDSYDVEKEYKYKVEVNGSLVTLYVNNVKIAESIQDTIKGQVKFFISSISQVTISNISVKNIKPKVFIVMQFSDDYNNLYNDVIKPVCEKHGLECERADEFYTSTPILADIIKSLKNCSIIIAEISPNNPNVFYEIGYAHAIKKSTILLCNKCKREILPFDLSEFRTIFYEDSITGKRAIENNLDKFLNTMLSV